MRLPELLYKYYSLDGGCRERTRRVVVEREVWFGSLNDFNDPFEARISLSMDAPDNLWRAEFGRPAPDAARIEEVCRALEQGVRDDAARIGMFCLSAKRDHILMWSHYAAKHRGICVGFRTTKPLFRDAEQVDYSLAFPAFNFFLSTKEERGRTILLAKAKCWDYEAEWRVLSADAGPGLSQYERGSLASVVLGCEMGEEDRAEVLRWVADVDDEIEIFQARRSHGSFGLTLDKLPSNKPLQPTRGGEF